MKAVDTDGLASFHFLFFYWSFLFKCFNNKDNNNLVLSLMYYCKNFIFDRYLNLYL